MITTVGDELEKVVTIIFVKVSVIEQSCSCLSPDGGPVISNVLVVTFVDIVSVLFTAVTDDVCFCFVVLCLGLLFPVSIQEVYLHAIDILKSQTRVMFPIGKEVVCSNDGSWVFVVTLEKTILHVFN